MIRKTVVLVGLMGSGKTSVGRPLAKILDLPFIDADDEIEAAAGYSISEIFERYGEAEFRKGERRVIERILKGPPVVLAAGGGAFMTPEIRKQIKETAVSVWLKADPATLHQRTRRTSHRPLLQTENPRKVLRDLVEKRYPVYGQADITVTTDNRPPKVTARRVQEELYRFLGIEETYEPARHRKKQT